MEVFGPSCLDPVSRKKMIRPVDIVRNIGSSAEFVKLRLQSVTSDESWLLSAQDQNSVQMHRLRSQSGKGANGVFGIASRCFFYVEFRFVA